MATPGPEDEAARLDAGDMGDAQPAMRIGDALDALAKPVAGFRSAW